MIINPELSSIYSITDESALSPLVMTPLQVDEENFLVPMYIFQDFSVASLADVHNSFVISQLTR